MDMLCAINARESAPFGVWRLKMSADELRHFGEPTYEQGTVSVLGISDDSPSFDGKTLVFSLKDARLLNRGSGDDVIAVKLTVGQNSDAVVAKTYTPTVVTKSHEQKGAGDDAFLSACESESMPKPMVDLAKKLLTAIREFSNDEIREGKNRKWITQPNNFIAVTIQNKKKNFAVHVKKTAELITLSLPKGPLDVRDDRPGYARFWITDEKTLSAAIKAARASFEMKKG